MDPRFEQFCQGRKYLSNVSPAHAGVVKQSLHWLGNPTPMSPG